MTHDVVIVVLLLLEEHAETFLDPISIKLINLCGHHSMINSVLLGGMRRDAPRVKMLLKYEARIMRFQNLVSIQLKQQEIISHLDYYCCISEIGK